MIRSKSRLLAFCLLALGAVSAMAQSWPPATVRIVVPYPPGTEPDVLARDLGNALSKQTGKAFVVDNRPGANSIVGTEVVTKGEADGSTLLMVDRLAVVTNPVLYAKMPYQWETALKPVSDLAGVNLFVGVREGLPVKNFAEFLQYAKTAPGGVNIGTGGNGHVNHIGMEMLKQAHGLNFSYVPYRGVAPAVLGLLSGEVDAVMAGGMVMQAHAKSGKIRLLAMGDTQRAMYLPDVPTLAEAGGKPGTIPSTVFALFAPAKVPDAVVTQINQAVAKVMDSSQVKGTYAVRGMDVATSTPQQTLASMKKDAVRYGKIIREAGIKLE